MKQISFVCDICKKKFSDQEEVKSSVHVYPSKKNEVSYHDCCEDCVEKIIKSIETIKK